MLRILCIGYCFPPVASPEAYVTAKVMGALPDARVDVLTADPTLLPLEPDHSLDSYVAKRFGTIVRVVPPPVARMLVRLPRLPLRPDRWQLLNASLLRQALRSGVRSYDCIVTRSQYHSAHLVGLALKRRLPELPWVATFSDPWTGAIYERSVPLASRWSRSMERRVLGGADALVFPTAEMRAFVDHSHPDANIADRASVVSHGFDRTLYGHRQDARAPTEVVRIGMFGSFYGPRSPRPLLDGLAALSNVTAAKFRLDVYGPNAGIFEQSLAEFPNLAGHVRHGGTLDHRTALARMADCDLLVMVDAPMPPPSIFLPSKLVDYIGTGRPIVAITPEGAAADVARSVGGLVASPDDPTAVAKVLADSIDLAARRPASVRSGPRAAYAVENVAVELRHAIERAIARCSAA